MTSNRITLSSDNKAWLGVLGGIAEGLQEDPFWIRFIYCMVALCTSVGVFLVLYLVLYYCMRPHTS